jgi:hypothetical protein
MPALPRTAIMPPGCAKDMAQIDSWTKSCLTLSHERKENRRIFAQVAFLLSFVAACAVGSFSVTAIKAGSALQECGR